jgi:hypothetical protein
LGVLVLLREDPESSPGDLAVADGAPIVNLKDARFECIYRRGCDGVCCREGRPLVYAEEAERIDANLQKFLPFLRGEARVVVEKESYLSRRRKAGQRVMRVSNGWCVFFNHGCVLQKVGAAEGEKFRYKPAVCALFPIQRDARGRWYVRQKGFKGEKWDLSCLDPTSSALPAALSLRDEIALVQRFNDEAGRAAGLDGARPAR